MLWVPIRSLSEALLISTYNMFYGEEDKLSKNYHQLLHFKKSTQYISNFVFISLSS